MSKRHAAIAVIETRTPLRSSAAIVVMARSTSPQSAYYLWASLATFTIVVLALVAYIRAERQIDRAHEQRYDSVVLADELRQSSDDLTRTVRSYVATGNPLYKRHYEEILDIREGRKPRPLDSDSVYWDLVLDDDVRPRPFGEAVAMQILMQRAGFTSAEFAKLTEAKTASDALTATEHAAMALAESDAGLTDKNRLRATLMLHDSAYRVAKAKIMRPIGEFRAMVVERTLMAVRASESIAYRLRLLLVTSGVVLVVLLWRLLASIRREMTAQIEQEALFRVVFDNAKVGLAHISTTGHFVNINQEYARITGYSREEILANQFTALDITHPEDRELSLKHFQKLLEENGNGYSITKRYNRKDGRTVWVELSLHLLRSEANAPTGFIAAAVDVTERVLAEEELKRHRTQLEQLVTERTQQLEDRNARLQNEIDAHQKAISALTESEATFRFIAENVHDVIWVINGKTGRYQYISPSITRQRGYSPEEYLEKSADSAFSALSAERINNAFADVRRRWEAGERVQFISLLDLELPHKNGQLIHVDTSMTMHADESGNLSSILGVTRDITERRRLEDSIRKLAFYDGLTDLPNRRLLLDRLQQSLARAKRARSRVALLFIDLDKFKPINDELGHQTGDWLLQSVAKRMLECLREYDTAARIGGDEFIILLPDLTYIEDALTVAERIRGTLAQPFITAEERKLEISSSIGVTIYPDHAKNERDLMRVGDEAMYRAKNSGRNKVELPNLAELPRSLSPERDSVRPDALMLLVWSSSYACGNADIDSEHRELFHLANRVLQHAAHRGIEPANFEVGLNALVEHVKSHFQHEEALLANKGYNNLQKHINMHRALLVRAVELSQRVKTARASIGELIEFVTFDVIGKHLLEDDRDFFPLFEHRD